VVLKSEQLNNRLPINFSAINAPKITSFWLGLDLTAKFPAAPQMPEYLKMDCAAGFFTLLHDPR
jgi:hypothetical protein